jgi:hypothetical protein
MGAGYHCHEQSSILCKVGRRGIIGALLLRRNEGVVPLF